VTSPFDDYEVEPQLRPKASRYDFDLDAALDAVVVLEARVPADAFTAASLGTQRLGNGIVLGTEGLVLTIGYLLMEADSVTLTTNDGREIPAHVLGSDPVTGFGLLQALEPLRRPGLPLGDSRKLKAGSAVILAGGGGRAHAAAGHVLSRQRFAGYWEYLLEDAIITEPPHPHWSGAALIGAAGELMGVGSLTMQHRTADGEIASNNLFVPSELLPPILDDLARGRPAHPPRPWLGLFAHDAGRHVLISGVSPGGPAARAELRAGDAILAVDGIAVTDLADLYTHVWACGPAGATIPLKVQREDDVFDLEVRSADRMAMMKKRRLN
jgi:S1-C subfamily serine protease